MTETLFRLEVWRPTSFDRQLAYQKDLDGITPQDRITPNVEELHHDRIYEQAYSWRIKGDIWTALTANEDATEIREFFTSEFSSDKPPEERTFNKLKARLEKLSNYLNDSDNRLWQTWEQPIDKDEENFYQIQPFLSLYYHLNWLYEVFHDVPGASVTIR